MEEVQYRELSRGLISRGLFVVYKYVSFQIAPIYTTPPTQRARKLATRGDHVYEFRQKKVGPTVEEVQYRESSRGLVSHGLFVAYKYVSFQIAPIYTTSQTQRARKLATRGDHVYEFRQKKNWTHYGRSTVL